MHQEPWKQALCKILPKKYSPLHIYCRGSLRCLSDKLWLMFARGFSPQKRQELGQNGVL